MITIRRWDSRTRQCAYVDPSDLRENPARFRQADALWIDLEAPSRDEERLVFEEFCPVHYLTLEDITRPRRDPESPNHLPKAEEFPDYLFVIVNPLSDRYVKSLNSPAPAGSDHDRPSLTQLSVVLDHSTLITHHYEPLESVARIGAVIAKNAGHLGRGPDYLFHLVLDAVVDDYALALDHVDDTLDEMEGEVFSWTRPALVPTLLRIKREVTVFRKSLVHQREVVARLSRGEFGLIDAQEEAYYRNVYDHLVRFSELAEASREMVSDLMQAHLAATSNRLNQTMKVLATVSTLILPMTLIAGIYGMNFDHMPELHWRFGYAWALGLMSVTGTISYLLFRWRGWV